MNIYYRVSDVFFFSFTNATLSASSWLGILPLSLFFSAFFLGTNPFPGGWRGPGRAAASLVRLPFGTFLLFSFF